MQKEIFENFQKLNQLALDNFRKLGETNLRIGEKLLAEQVELTNSLLESAAENAETVSEAKDLKDVASWQAEWAQEATKKVIESSRACADICAEAGKVYSNLFEAGIKSASSAAEKTSSKAKKAA